MFDLARLIDAGAFKHCLHHAFLENRIVVDRVISEQQRVLFLKIDSSTALVMSYSSEFLLKALNEELGEMSVDKINLIHFTPIKKRDRPKYYGKRNRICIK